jgi:hypothetical protein
MADLSRKANDFLNLLEAEHSLEEVKRSLGLMAKVLADYFASLIQCGFSEEQAMRICLDWQNTTLKGGK